MNHEMLFMHWIKTMSNNVCIPNGFFSKYEESNLAQMVMDVAKKYATINRIIAASLVIQSLSTGGINRIYVIRSGRRKPQL